MAYIIILGAGLTGLSAAYHLEQSNFFDYILLEKESTAGGLCRSITCDGFTFDYTGHILHVQEKTVTAFLNTINFPQYCNTLTRRAGVYSQGVYTSYPYQNNLYGLPSETIIECITGFVERTPTIQAPRTFYDWVLHNFGAGFGKHFFFPFQQKLFAYNIKKISASWTGKFVPSTSLSQLLHGALGNVTTQVGYNTTFLYPKEGGIQQFANSILQYIHMPIKYNHTVSAIDIKNKRVLFTNGASEEYTFLITTLPLDTLLLLLQEPSSLSLAGARSKLLCNSIINFNIGVNRPNLSPYHWLYIPEKKYPFYRIGFWHNFSSAMTPPDCSSLYGELAYFRKSPQALEHMIKKALKYTYQLCALTPQEIVLEKILPISHAYVMYTPWRDKYLPHILQRLQEYNIYSIGRYGAWKYSSMQDAILDGKHIAELLLMR